MQNGVVPKAKNISSGTHFINGRKYMTAAQ
jgi:hypothetical protein